METPPRDRPEPDDDDLEGLEDEDPFAEVEQDEDELAGLSPQEVRSLEGEYLDEPLDPAMRPVIEAGGGVAEGFEQAEELLVEHAEDPPLNATKRVQRDAGEEEPDEDPGVYGEADEERSSEDEDDY